MLYGKSNKLASSFKDKFSNFEVYHAFEAIIVSCQDITFLLHFLQHQIEPHFGSIF